MFSETSGRLNKIIFWKYPGKKNLSKVHDKKTTELFHLMPSNIFIISFKHVFVVCDEVCF